MHCFHRMNLPNTLTLVRIFLVPLLVVVLLTQAGREIFGVPKELLGAAIFRKKMPPAVPPVPPAAGV